MTTVEIVYNAISFVIAIITTILFTVYAKKALADLEERDLSDVAETRSRIDFEMERLPLERPKHLWSFA